MPKIASHYHWMFQAINSGRVNPVEVTVIGHQTEPDAEFAVRELLKRDDYILTKVWECNTCKYQETVTRILKFFSRGDK